MSLTLLFALLCAACAAGGRAGGEYRLSGTGFFVTGDGVLVTCAHVAQKASGLRARVAGAWLPARIMCIDTDNDVAVLKVDAKTVPLPLSRRFAGRKGEEVFILGYPMPDMQGEEQKATFGRVNALSGARGNTRYAQVDAPVQPGNSGSPLCNDKGEVIGMISRSLDENLARKNFGAIPQNVNYALKAEYVLQALMAAGVDVPPATGGAAPEDFVRLVALREPSVVFVSAE
jgi:S1-C subfamily serine protease